MRVNCSLSRCLCLFSISTLFPLICSGSLRAQTAGIDVDYTGSLMGYYRMEADEDASKNLPPVKEFLIYRSDPDNNGRLLLGMGDNFGPEFGASLQLENAAGSPCYLAAMKLPDKQTKPESLYKNDDRIANAAPCDNVLNFMMHAGFRAVVPGYQDFMYTARWLRGAARLLAEASDSDGGSPVIKSNDHHLNLLAANLRIALSGKVSQVDKGGSSRAASVTGRCPLLFSKNPFAENTIRCVGDVQQAEPLDWLDRLDRLSRGNGNNATVSALRDLATESAVTAADRNSALNSLVRDEISIMYSAWGAQAGSKPRPGLPELPNNPQSGKGKGGSQDLTAEDATRLATSLENLNQNECKAAPSEGDLTDLCTYTSKLVSILQNLSKIIGSTSNEKEKVSGATLLLTTTERKAAINGLLRTIADEEENVGYAVAGLPNNRKALIVGVVGDSTMKAVSQTNLRLCIGAPVAGKSTTEFGFCEGRSSSDSPQYGLSASVLITDATSVTEALVRGVELKYGDFDSVIVMAQMPRTEAEVLAERVWTRLKLAGATRPVDVVLSEADAGYGTPDLTLNYPASTGGTHSPPVLTPVNSYSSQDGSYPGAVSRLTIDAEPGKSYSLANKTEGIFAPPGVNGSVTTVSLLYKLMAELRKTPDSQKANSSTTEPNKQGAEFALLKELQESSTPNADVVLLQSRDMELDKIGEDYTDYSMCNGDPNLEMCKLRAALDRILWKGDFLEYVAVQGKDLKALLDSSQKMMAEQAKLSDTGVDREWLISYGVVQSALTNLTEISQNDEPLWIPVDPSCSAASGGKSTYCVEGTPIADDAYYWLLTTDQLAEDKAVYGTLQNLPSTNHKTPWTYVTASLSKHLLKQLSSAATADTVAKLPSNQVERVVTVQNEIFQQRSLWQVDFSKVIASFTSRQPVGGNQFVGNYFQGASDARATAPSQQELDLEMASRVSGLQYLGHKSDGTPAMPVSFGLQSSFAYDRSVLGNLTPASKPVNASYALNNFTIGPFLQFRLHGKRAANSVQPVRSLPRNMFVLAPRQYQVQINNQFLFFPFANSSPVPGELRVTLPRSESWTDRAGFRSEFGDNRPGTFFQAGSYVETGMEFSIQGKVLSALTLQTGANQKTCQARPTSTLQSCFSQAPPLVINNSTTLVGSAAVETLHTPGVYWQLHLQKNIFGGKGKAVSLVADSQGDYYFGRPPSAELPTQTEYAIPLSLSLVFPALGNLSFAPTYSGFYYQAQRSNQSLQVNSLSIAARWYFARDARVPLPKQARLPGPASADQTKTGKAH